ncbi:MAG: flagellar basal body-associated FliL family protein [Thermodesulfovibrionales bacterium]|nr:flagellar basal body-associated FliL family protein [Thermodesulfovibrionales bacterium]
MAEEKEGAEGGEPKKKGSKLLIIIIIAVIVLAGAGGGTYFFLFKKSDKKEEKKEEKPSQTVNFGFDPFVVNLSDATSNRFLKVTIQIELANAKLVDIAKSRTPQMRDAIITLLTSKSSDTLIAPEGKLQLKDEITIRMNQIMGEGNVKNVFLTEFVMQ